MAELIELFRRTLKHEGGFQNDPDDDGNWTGGKKGVGVCNGTNYGISAASYPKLDIEHLTEGEAINIYLKDYYLKLGLEKIKSARVRWKLFDISINMGADDPPKIVRDALKDIGYVVGDGLEYERLNDASAFWKTDEVVVRELAEWQVKKYVQIVIAKPQRLKYLRTWVWRGFDTAESMV